MFHSNASLYFGTYVAGSLQTIFNMFIINNNIFTSIMLVHLSSNLSELLSRYHLKDVIVGKIYFLLVRIKIKHMELAIIKRETTGTGRSFIVIMMI